MFNEVTLIGRLGKDPELRMTPSNMPVCSLWLATSEYSNRDGQKEERTEWHSVATWGNQAEAASKYLKKGSLVFIKGKIQSREYQDKQGVSRKQYEIVANTVKFLSPKAEAPQKNEATTTHMDLDTIPF